MGRGFCGLLVLVGHTIRVLVYGVVDCGGELVWCGGKLQLWYHSGFFFFFFFLI